MRVEFERDYLRSSYKVYMFEDTPSGRVFYRADDVAITITEGNKIDHEGVVFCRIPDQALKLFADKLSSLGIKTDDDHKIAGVLEATKYHLEDMRKLAKVK